MTTQNTNQTNDTHFKKFTNKFSLTKTLRFELKRALFDEDGKLYISKDTTSAWEQIEKQQRKLNQARSDIKPLIDKLHQEFIESLLETFKEQFHEGQLLLSKNTKNQKYKVILSNSESVNESEGIKEYSLWHVYKRLQKGDLEERKRYRNIWKELMIELSKSFKEYANKHISGKYVGVKESKGKQTEIPFTKNNLVSGESLIYLLKDAYKEEKDQETINAFNKITGALSDLAENRKHYYEVGGKHGQIATRLFNENLQRFLQNKYLYEEKIKKHFTAEDETIFDVANYFTKFLDKKGLQEYNEKIAKFNSDWNEKLQKIQQEDKKEARKLPRSLSVLYKHIGDEKEALFESIDSYDELIERLVNAKTQAIRLQKKYKEFWDYFKEVIEDEEALDNIYIKKTNITKLSQDILIDWQSLNGVYCKDSRCKSKHNLRSLADIKAYIEKVSPRITEKQTATWDAFKKVWLQNEFAVLDGGEAFKELKINDQVSQKVFPSMQQLLQGYEEAVADLKKYDSVKSALASLGQEGYKKRMDQIRGLLERINLIIKRVKIFGHTGSKGVNLLDEVERFNEEFYQKVDNLLQDEESANFNKLYNLIRNFLRKEEKEPDFIRVYYSSAFLGGWDVNKIRDKFGFYFKDPSGGIYLAVVSPQYAKEVADYIQGVYFGKVAEASSPYKALAIKTMGDPAKDIPTLFLVDGETKRIVGKKDEHGNNKKVEEARQKYWPKEVYEAYKQYGFGKDLNASVLGREVFDSIVSFFKDRLNQYHSDKTGLYFEFKEHYDSWGEFVEDISLQAYTARWISIPEDKIRQWLQKEKIFLFKICNKDLCRNTKNCSIWNTHTIIFKELFSQENLSNGFPIRLLGEAKILLRDPKSDYIKSQDKSGRLLKRADGSQEYESHRYTEKKLMFHFAVQINALAELSNPSQSEVNKLINTQLLSKTNPKIIGIDRGEKHLLYKALIDEDGNIENINSLNKINIAGKEVDFKQKLKEAEKSMNENTLHWLPVGSIVEKKEGYLSHIMNLLLKEVLDNDAIIVLENLNFGFARRRGGQFKASVYQQFQKKLLQKLSFALDKRDFFNEAPCDPECPKNQQKCFEFKKDTLGKLSQLVPQLAEDNANIAFSDLKGQHGIVLFVEASHTSTTCPHCGWFKENPNIHYTSIADTKKAYSDYGFKIYQKENHFEIKYVAKHEYKENGRTKKAEFERSISSNVDRWYFEQAKKKYHFIDSQTLNRFLQAIFTNGAKENEFEFFAGGFAGFNLPDLEGDIFARIIDNETEDANTWKAFVFAMNRIFAIRNSISEQQAQAKEVPEKEQDFLHCPRCGFDTRKSNEFPDGDAVGAYNIARKGQIVLERIKENPEDPNTAVSRYDWMKFVFKNDL